MSSFRALVDSLRRDALAASSRIFEAGRARRPALGSYPDVASVLAAFADDRAESYPERDALTQALLTEHRESGQKLWATMLVAAYYPMLSRLRHRLVCDAVPKAELNQVVLTAFLTAAAELPPREQADRVAMRLRQRTERQVFAFLRKEREQQRPDPLLEELAMHREDMIRAKDSESLDDRRFDLARLLERAAELGIPKDRLELVAATVLRRELLRNYVERIGPDDELERERMYQRLKRQRTRVLQQLENMFSESPIPLASGF